MEKKAGIEILKTAMWVSALVLAVCVVLTGTILCSRLMDFLTYESTTVMELAPETDSNSVSASVPAPQTETKTPTGGAYTPGFEARDDLVVWQEMTEVEIFRITYDETGDVTVDGTDESVLAPGTSNTYDFSLKNTGNVELKYTLTAEAKFSDTELSVPVSVRLNGADGSYLVGSENSFEAAEELNDISDTHMLAPATYANYALEWQWPFEGDWGDEFDTALGNRAVDEDITMTVVLRVNAEADISDAPYTGDSGIALYVVIAVAALAVMLLLILILKKSEKKGNTND